MKRKISILERQYPKRVDFHANAMDFRCAFLASLGWTTNAIARDTNLSPNQISYRIGKFERARKVDELTQRSSYRNGKSPVAQMVANIFASKNSQVNKHVVKVLGKRKLYAPIPKGVMTDTR